MTLIIKKKDLEGKSLREYLRGNGFNGRVMVVRDWERPPYTQRFWWHDVRDRVNEFFRKYLGFQC